MPRTLRSVASAAERAAVDIDVELQKAQKGQDAIDSLRNLTVIASRLAEIVTMLRQGCVSCDDGARGTIGRLVVDTWPLRHPLGERLIEVEYDFERLGS
jgi:hypothetical protein